MRGPQMGFYWPVHKGFWLNIEKWRILQKEINLDFLILLKTWKSSPYWVCIPLGKRSWACAIVQVWHWGVLLWFPLSASSAVSLLAFEIGTHDQVWQGSGGRWDWKELLNSGPQTSFWGSRSMSWGTGEPLKVLCSRMTSWNLCFRELSLLDPTDTPNQI